MKIMISLYDIAITVEVSLPLLQRELQLRRYGDYRSSYDDTVTIVVAFFCARELNKPVSAILWP